MDETKTWWFKAIAKHAHGLFAVTWGIGLGNFLAVTLKIVDVSGYTLTFYLAITTALMAGMLSVISSRAMDALADRRAIRRKLFNARTIVSQLAHELDQLSKQIAVAKSVPGRSISSDGSNLTHDEAAQIIVRCNRITQHAEEIPNFEDLVENRQDSLIEWSCRSNFLYCQHAFKVPTLSDLELDRRRKLAADYILHSSPANAPYSAGDVLAGVVRYIDARLDGPT
jgi:hypothetical protein